MKKVILILLTTISTIIFHSCSNENDLISYPAMEQEGFYEMFSSDLRFEEFIVQKSNLMKFMKDRAKEMNEKQISALVTRLEEIHAKDEFSHEDSIFVAASLGFESLSKMNQFHRLSESLSMTYPNYYEHELFLKYVYSLTGDSEQSFLKRTQCQRACDTQYWIIGAGCIAASATLIPALGCAAINAAIYYNCLSNCPQA